MKTGSQFKEKLQRIQNTRQAGGRAQPRAEGPGRAAGQGAGRFLTTASNHAPRASPKGPPNIRFRLSISEENSHYQVEGKTPHMPGTSDFEALEQLPRTTTGKGHRRRRGSAKTQAARQPGSSAAALPASCCAFLGAREGDGTETPGRAQCGQKHRGVSSTFQVPTLEAGGWHLTGTAETHGSLRFLTAAESPAADQGSRGLSLQHSVVFTTRALRFVSTPPLWGPILISPQPGRLWLSAASQPLALSPLGVKAASAFRSGFESHEPRALSVPCGLVALPFKAPPE